jgi:chemotaxis response regulator CheB
MAKAVCRLLSLDCDVVGSIADGSALLEAAQRLQPEVVVLDVNLPNVNGLEACRQILQVHPEMKVIVFTAMEDSGVRATVLRARRSCLCVQTGARRSVISDQKTVCRPSVINPLGDPDRPEAAPQAGSNRSRGVAGQTMNRSKAAAGDGPEQISGGLIAFARGRFKVLAIGDRDVAPVILDQASLL